MAAGTRFGAYEVMGLLGRGGMATVYLAQDHKHHRRVAVKVLHAEVAAAVRREWFLREIDIAAGLHHPHILTLHDSGDVDGRLYYVMPHVEGESLRQRLSREGRHPAGQRAAHRPERWPERWTTPIARAWCIATSSRRTSCCRTVRRSSPTSASPERSPRAPPTPARQAPSPPWARRPI